MIKEILKDAEERMNKTIHTLETDLSKLRAGRAHPSLLDDIKVPYFGTDTPLSQLASVTVEGPLMLVVKPWEKQLASTIAKAIGASDLGLNPSASSDVIRVPLPPLSEERRRELGKKVKGECEESKISVRNIRRDANSDFKNLLKEKDISEDDAKNAEDMVQKLTDKAVIKIDQMFEQKQKDLLVM